MSAHHGPVCGLHILWLRIAIEPLTLFYHSVLDYMCFTVRFKAKVEDTSDDRMYICNLEVHQN